MTLGAKLAFFPSIDPVTRTFMKGLTIRFPIPRNDDSHRSLQCFAHLPLTLLLVHMSVPSERQVSLHTDSWQHHNPELHVQEEPSHVTFEFSKHHCRPPRWGTSMNLHVLHHQIFSRTEDFFLHRWREEISSFGFRQVVLQNKSTHELKIILCIRHTVVSTLIRGPVFASMSPSRWTFEETFLFSSRDGLPCGASEKL